MSGDALTTRIERLIPLRLKIRSGDLDRTDVRLTERVMGILTGPACCVHRPLRSMIVGLGRRGGPSSITILLHPNTDDPRSDHLYYTLWVNRSQPVNAYAWKRPGEKGAPAIEKILPNTKPTVKLEV